MNAAWIAALSVIVAAGFTFLGVAVTARVSKRSAELAEQNRKADVANRATELTHDATRIVADAHKDARDIEAKVLVSVLAELERQARQMQEMRTELSDTTNRAGRLEEALDLSERNFQRSQRNVETLRQKLIDAGIPVPPLERIELPRHPDQLSEFPSPPNS